MNKITQKQIILDYCKTNTWITQRDAYKLGIMRLASRINDMKRLGYWIATDFITVENADGSKSRVAEYKIVKYLGEELENVG